MPTISKILYVTDKNFDPTCSAFVQAVTIAKANQALLRVLRVLPEMKPLSYSTQSSTIEMMTQEVKVGVLLGVNEAIEQSHSDLNYKSEVAFGKTFFEAIRSATNYNCDLVVKQSEDPSWLSSMFGSDDLHLVRKCPCPVLFVPKSAPTSFHRIAAAVDLNEDEYESRLNIDIIQHTVKQAQYHDAKTHLISIFDTSVAGFASLWADSPEKLEQSFLSEESQRRRHAAEKLIKAAEQESKNKRIFVKHIVEGDPGKAIPELVDNLNADLVIMGSVGRSGVLGILIGNTAETVLLQLKCSVLVLKPQGFVSPLNFQE